MIERLRQPSRRTREMMDDLVKKYPPLTEEKERDLFMHYKNDRRTLEDLLVLHHAAFIIPHAKRWAECYRCADIDDMIQLGFIGLVKAARNFDQEKYRVRFCTYAGYKIRAEMQYGTRLLSHKLDASIISLDSKVDNGEEEQSMMEIVQGKMLDEYKYTPLGEWLEKRDLEVVAKNLMEVSDLLGERLNQIWEFVKEGVSYSRIAKYFGVSRERIRQVVESGCKRAVRNVKRWQPPRLKNQYYDYWRPSRSSGRVVVTHKCSWDIELYIAFERFQLNQKHKVRNPSPMGFTEVFTRTEGPILPDVVFCGGRDGTRARRNLKTEESYGF